MGYTLIVNTGSSSKKYALYNDEVLLLSMRFERHNEGFEVCSEINNARQKCEGVGVAQFKNGLDYLFDMALQEKLLVYRNDISRVCVRVVAPGTYFQQHRILDELYLSKLRAAAEEAPLHVPMLLRELSYIQKRLPAATIVCASDSAFHASMPSLTRDFSIDKDDARELDLYRFGYHGISLSSVMKKVPRVLKEMPGRLIVCHIGSGVSVTAIKNGVSFDTSMGYAPGGGLIMGTRAGDLETEALLKLMNKRHMRPLDAELYLETQGGLRALCGNADLRALLNLRTLGDAKAASALDMFVHHLRMKIGAYIAGLGGLDALILTATASERNAFLRSLLLQGMESLGITLDQERNNAAASHDAIISSTHSVVDVAVIRTNETEEMRLIAQSLAS